MQQPARYRATDSRSHRLPRVERIDPVKGTIQFSATVTDAGGHTIVVTPTWSVVNGGGMITRDCGC